MPGDGTICEDFFKVIDTPLKAYIIGLIAFNKTDGDDNVDVEIKLNNVKEYDNNNKCISYGYYIDLKDEDKKHYPYFNNIDILVKHLEKVGNVKYTEQTCINGIIELTITSQK